MRSFLRKNRLEEPAGPEAIQPGDDIIGHDPKRPAQTVGRGYPGSQVLADIGDSKDHKAHQHPGHAQSDRGKEEPGSFVHHHPTGIVPLEAKATYRPIATGNGESKGSQPSPDRLQEEGNRQGKKSGDGPRATIAASDTPQQQTAAKEGRNHSSHWQAA